MLTWGQLKIDLRQILWPQGEAVNLAIPHNQDFLDAIIDLQESVACLQVDNTNLFQQCATFYNCGLTVLDSPGRGGDQLIKVSVVAKAKGQDDVNVLDWCTEHPYTQVDACHIHRYLGASRRRGSCLSILAFFGLGWRDCGWNHPPPVPTNAGLPPGLPALPLGFSYPQTSTDRPHRCRQGVWAIERGKIWIAPWIQSDETVLIMWDGVKRTWADGDPVDNDPNLLKAIREYVRWQHCDHWEKDEAEAQRAETAFIKARAWLMHQCRMGTLVRDCRPSQARSSVQSLIALFYNDEQSAAATCPDGQAGSPVSGSVTIQAGTVASNISVADANLKAAAQALQQAQAQLNCTTPAQTWTNNRQGNGLASCQQSPGAPVPDGNPQIAIVAIGTVTSSVSQGDANLQADAQAQIQAQNSLSCTFWNSEQTQTAYCPADHTISETKTVAEHTFSSPFSQSAADNLAIQDALNQAKAAIVANILCTNSGLFWNTAVTGHGFAQSGQCSSGVAVAYAAHQDSSAVSQADANQIATANANELAWGIAIARAGAGQCGPYSTHYP